MIIQGITVQSVTVASSAATVSTDSYFNLVSLLLPGNGTNGAQNNTFLDSSTNNFSITRNGNTTQGTFSPFSQTGWSNYFDGSGDYLSITNNAVFTFSGDFTIEFWVHSGSNALVNLAYPTMFATSAFNGTGIGLKIQSSGGVGTTGVACVWNNGSQILTGTTVISNNTWYHVAVSRSGTSTKLFVNGAVENTITNSTTFTVAAGYPLVGADTTTTGNLTGYISNLRVVKGQALYTAAFTPSTSPLTTTSQGAVAANVSLLTCQSNRFVDNSSNAFAITASGNTSVQAFAPFNPTAAYAASTVGGSGYFDGTGDYLSIATNTALDFGSSNFTAECWIYPISFDSVDGAFMAVGAQAGSASWVLRGDNTGVLNFVFWSGGTTISTNISSSSGAIKLYSWNHIALTRNGSSFNIWANGVSVATATNATAIGNTGRPAYICYGYGDNAGRTSNCYISSVRWVKGSAVYTAAFTPPTAPLTAIANTSLLLNYTNAGITDATAKNVLETVGDAKISTAQSKWGGSSMLFDGTGDWLLTRTSPNLDMSTGDLTIEGWFYLTTSPADYQMIVSDATNGNNYVAIRGGGTGGQIEVNVNGTSFRFNLNNSVSANTWFHLAVTRSTNTWYGFINGTSLGNTTNSGSFNLGNGGMYVGRFGGGTAYAWPGYMDDLRITRGYARYTANFTAPTTAFPTQ